MRRTNPLTRSESLYAAMEHLQRAQALGEQVLIETAEQPPGSRVHGVPPNWSGWSVYALLLNLEAKGLLTREIVIEAAKNSLRAVDATIELIAKQIETSRPTLPQIEMDLEPEETIADGE